MSKSIENGTIDYAIVDNEPNIESKELVLPEALSARLLAEKQKAEADVSAFIAERQGRLNDLLNTLLDGYILSLPNGDKRRFRLSDDMRRLVEQAALSTAPQAATE